MKGYSIDNSSGAAIVKTMAQLRLTGNIIPAIWLQRLVSRTAANRGGLPPGGGDDPGDNGPLCESLHKNVGPSFTL